MIRLSWCNGESRAAMADELRKQGLMLLEEYRFTCRPHRHEFEAPDAPAGSYGIFLLRSATGALAELNAFDDPEFNEVSAMVDRECRLRAPGVGTRELGDRAALTHFAFGTTCDPAPDGSRLSLETKPQCPACSTFDMADQTPLGKWITPPVPAVSHRVWRALAPAAREQIIRAIVEAWEAREAAAIAQARATAHK